MLRATNQFEELALVSVSITISYGATFSPQYLTQFGHQWFINGIHKI